VDLFNKIKDMFTEEVDEEPVAKPVKKEMTKVEIPAPAPKVDAFDQDEEEEEKEDTKPVPMVEPKPVVKEKAPVFFDDDDFKELEPKKEEVKVVAPVEPKKVDKPGLYGVLREEEHKFKPSKIISPVYGVLGENYDTDDINHTDQPQIKVKPKSTYVAKSKTPTLDEVRNRAFGTLEDELEDTLTKNGPTIFDEEKDNFYTEVKTTKHAKTEEDKLDPDMTLEELDELAKKKEKDSKKLEGNELFDLIDSMYDDKDDKGDDE